METKVGLLTLNNKRTQCGFIPIHGIGHPSSNSQDEAMFFRLV